MCIRDRNKAIAKNALGSPLYRDLIPKFFVAFTSIFNPFSRFLTWLLMMILKVSRGYKSSADPHPPITPEKMLFVKVGFKFLWTCFLNCRFRTSFGKNLAKANPFPFHRALTPSVFLIVPRQSSPFLYDCLIYPWATNSGMVCSLFLTISRGFIREKKALIFRVVRRTDVLGWEDDDVILKFWLNEFYW